MTRMAHLRSLAALWRRWKDGAASQLLRDPNVILFERLPGQAPQREGARGG
jgi:hypothetical protein